MTKILLVGPYPPPHGGVSVHVAELKQRTRAAGIPCRVLNSDRRADPHANYISARWFSGFLMKIFIHARRGWTIHVHTNGHNVKSWIVALAGGVVGRAGPGTLLTLHSGKLPGYLSSAHHRRWLAKATCRLFRRITCVSPRLQHSLESIGIPADKIEVAPAFRAVPPTSLDWALAPQLEKWLARHRPVLSATASDRPEYGMDLLIEAVHRLSSEFKNLGCVLMGIGNEAGQLRALIERLNLTQSVLLLGDRAHGECVHLISKSAVFVRPTYTDGDSISVREALSLGVPTIASNAVNRPGGVILFETGNPEDLKEKLACVFQEQLHASAR